jgi:heterodisulfide reductase subunit B
MEMVFSYYPGCTLKTKAKDLDKYARLSAEALGVTLEELENWQCCGGVYPIAKEETAPKLSSVRALNQAKELGRDLVTMCSACHNVIKQVNNDMKNDEKIRNKANLYMKLDPPYEGETNVIHYLELLRDTIGFDEIKKRVTNPLTGVKIAPYYGCLLLRPSSVMQMDDPENPTIMEDFIKALGAQPVKYAMRNECCGGYTTLENKEIAKKKGNAVLENAVQNGAQMVITACPLCLYNLNKNATDYDVPVKYFTEVLANALGIQ